MPIVILDEATASVDADNESYIQQAISELCKGKTLLVIAHRLNTITHADRIMVVKDGQIAESGVHGSLMAKDDIYRSMVTKRAVSTGWKNQTLNAAEYNDILVGKLSEYIKVNRKTEITIIFIRESLNDDIKKNSLSDPMSDRL